MPTYVLHFFFLVFARICSAFHMLCRDLFPVGSHCYLPLSLFSLSLPPHAFSFAVLCVRQRARAWGLLAPAPSDLIWSLAWHRLAALSWRLAVAALLFGRGEGGRRDGCLEAAKTGLGMERIGSCWSLAFTRFALKWWRGSSDRCDWHSIGGILRWIGRVANGLKAPKWLIVVWCVVLVSAFCFLPYCCCCYCYCCCCCLLVENSSSLIRLNVFRLLVGERRIILSRGWFARLAFCNRQCWAVWKLIDCWAWKNGRKAKLTGFVVEAAMFIAQVLRCRHIVGTLEGFSSSREDTLWP